jgi:hypothetical protein
MWNIFISGIIYFLTNILFVMELLNYSNKFHKIWLPINMISFYGYIYSLNKLLRDGSYLQISTKYIIATGINVFIIISSVYHTTYEVFDCIKNNCTDNNVESLEFLSIVINGILLLSFLIHYMYNITKTNDEYEDENNGINIDKNINFDVYNIFVGVYLSLLIYNIITDTYDYTYDQILICNSVIVFCIICIVRSMFMKQLRTFRDLFVVVFGVISLILVLLSTIVITYVLNTYYKDIKYLRTSIINMILSIFLLVIVIFFRICETRRKLPEVNNNNENKNDPIIDELIERYKNVENV